MSAGQVRHDWVDYPMPGMLICRVCGQKVRGFSRYYNANVRGCPQPRSWWRAIFAR